MKFRKTAFIFLFVFLLFTSPVVAGSSPPGDIATFLGQGDALIKTENYSGAAAAYDKAIALDGKNFTAWNSRADALNRAGNFSEALAASDAALAIAPSNAAGWMNRGYILYNLGKYDDELSAYETAITLEPDNAQAWFNKGYALAGLKRYDEAIAAFDKVQALQPDYPNLAGNRRIAEQLRDAQTPAIVRYAPVIAGILVVLGISGIYLFSRRKVLSQEEEPTNRQGRRRKERNT